MKLGDQSILKNTKQCSIVQNGLDHNVALSKTITDIMALQVMRRHKYEKLP